MSKPYSNNSTQRERKALVHSDTFVTRAMHDVQQEQQGRFSKAVTVVGRDLPIYPRVPDGNPWANDPVGVEPPTNRAIDDQEPVGEYFEVQASLAAQQDEAVPNTLSDDLPAPATDDVSLSASSASPPPGFDQAAPVLRKLVRVRRRSL